MQSLPGLAGEDWGCSEGQRVFPEALPVLAALPAVGTVWGLRWCQQL